MNDSKPNKGYWCRVFILFNSTSIMRQIIRFVFLFLFCFIIIPSCSSNDKIDEIDNTIDKSSIHYFNPYSEIMPRLTNIRKAWKEYGDKNNETNFVLLHVSDFHGSQENILRLSDFLSVYSSYIDDVLHTGDLLATDLKDEVPSEFNNKWLQVIGNHDAILSSEKGSIEQPSIDSYNKLFAPFISNWSVHQPDGSATEGKCYYYKDYPDSGIRLITLDCVNSHWDLAQRIWFESVLDEVLDINNKAFGYHIIVAAHYPAFKMEKQPGNPFDSLDYSADIRALCNEEIPLEIKRFKKRGGSFVCYLTGHLHIDLFGLGVANGEFFDQLCISIACNNVGVAQWFSDMERIKGEKSQDCFNILGVDTRRNVIKMMRVGADYDRYLRHKNVICWDYHNNQLVYTE